MKTDLEAANQYHAYMQGFRDGAGISAMEPSFTQHSKPYMKTAYEDGYNDGCRERQKASAVASVRYNYTPSILRTCSRVGLNDE